MGNDGLAYDCSNDVLYSVDADTSRLFQGDPATGAATPVGSFGESEINDLVYYPPCE